MTDFLYLGIVLYLVVILTSLFTFYQEYKSEAIMNSFKDLLPSKAKVIRNSVYDEIESSNIVVGDLILLRQGDKINADIRLIESNSLYVDNSILTGESHPQLRIPDKFNKNILESNNMIFLGTTVVEGNGKGIVLNIGDNTQMGKIAGLTQNTKKIDTPINREINYFIKIISSIAIILGIIFMILSFINDSNIIMGLINPIGIIVANVPEGLLATVTIILAFAAKQMANKNVLVKNLETVESLGSTSVICTDKTGTLTKNHLTVSNIIFNSNIIDYKKPPIDDLKPYWDHFLQTGIQCNNVQIKTNEDLTKKYLGNPTDRALAEWIYPQMNKLKFNKLLLEIPFDSSNKFHLIIYGDGDHVHYYMKGASDIIINFCGRIIKDSKLISLRTEDIENNERLQNIMAEKGERIIGMAYKSHIYDESVEYSLSNLENLLSEFTFLGMVSFEDPPRRNVPWSVNECINAGIKVVMVTGDLPETALSIAKQTFIIDSTLTIFNDKPNKDINYVAIINDKTINNLNDILSLDNVKALVIKGICIDKLTDEYWIKIIKKPQLVFARTSPEQKLIIVSKFQEQGEIVAVTGDGVNDTPALKKADIGIAME
jgi:sodium/potassium-transporting ATPase subunit alpha